MPYKKKGLHKRPWMGQVRIKNSKPLRKAFSTKKEAKQWEEEQKNKGICLMSTVSLGEWAIRYLNFAKEKFASVTYIEKIACFKLFFQSMDKDFSINRFSAGMALTHLQKQAKSRSGNAANKDRKNLRSAWAWGIKYMNLSKENPFDVEKFREDRQKRYVPPESDFWKVYETALTEQDKLMLLAYLHLAARRSELFRLIWDDVNFEDAQIRLYTRKTKDGSWEGDWLPMTEDLKNMFIEHKKRSRGNFRLGRMSGKGNPGCSYVILILPKTD